MPQNHSLKTLLDAWLVPPDTTTRQTRSRRSGGSILTQRLSDLVEQFCNYQLKQRGRTEKGVKAYRWTLEQFILFARRHHGQLARVVSLDAITVQAWMDEMAGADLAISTIRTRQCVLSSFCTWLVKRGVLKSNSVATLDRPPHREEPPRQVPGSELMNNLIRTVIEYRQPRDLAVFLILRYSGLRREAVASLRAGQVDVAWGLRNVKEKGGKVRDIPLPSAVMNYLGEYITQVLTPQLGFVTPDTPLFWSRGAGGKGRKGQGIELRPMAGKSIWRLCKIYGRHLGYPELKPHDLRHGVAMELYEQHRDLETVRAMLGHSRIDTTQVYAHIRPQKLQQAIRFYDEQADDLLSKRSDLANRCDLCGQLSSRPLYIDHDHTTLKIRGRLCASCNSGIGQLKDDPELMGKAAEYVRKSQVGSTGSQNT